MCLPSSALHQLERGERVGQGGFIVVGGEGRAGDGVRGGGPCGVQAGELAVEALVGGDLGAQARRLLVAEHLHAGELALAVDADGHFQGVLAAVAGGGQGEGVARAVGGLVDLPHRVGQAVGLHLLKGIRGGQHLQPGLLVGLALGLRDNGGGDTVGEGQQAAHDDADEHQHNDGGPEIGHHIGFGFRHACTPPNGFVLVQSQMYGLRIFISRMEKDTPSGKLPHTRMSTVMRPQPTPKMSLPLGVGGEVV